MRLVIEGLTLGLATGGWCLATCAPFMVPLLMAGSRDGLPNETESGGSRDGFPNETGSGGTGRGASPGRDGLRAVGLFLSGRAVAYAAFALVASYLGHADVIPPGARTGVLLACALVMLAVGTVTVTGTRDGFPIAARSGGPCPGRLARPLSRAPFVLGLLLGASPCPPFVLGLARLVELGDPVGGLVFFGAFFCGTALLSLPFAAVPALARGRRMQRVGALASVLAGLWFLATALLAL